MKYENEDFAEVVNTIVKDRLEPLERKLSNVEEAFKQSVNRAEEYRLIYSNACYDIGRIVPAACEVREYFRFKQKKDVGDLEAAVHIAANKELKIIDLEDENRRLRKEKARLCEENARLREENAQPNKPLPDHNSLQKETEEP